VQAFNVFLYAVAILICLWLNFFVPLFREDMGQNTAMEYVAMAILVAYNALILAVGGARRAHRRADPVEPGVLSPGDRRVAPRRRDRLRGVQFRLGT